MPNHMIAWDPPRHTAHRALLMRQFTPKRLKATEDFIQTLAERLIDKFIDRGELELMSD